MAVGHSPAHHRTHSLPDPSGGLLACSPYWRQHGEHVSTSYPVYWHIAKAGHRMTFKALNPIGGVLLRTPAGSIDLHHGGCGFPEGWNPRSWRLLLAYWVLYPPQPPLGAGRPVLAPSLTRLLESRQDLYPAAGRARRCVAPSSSSRFGSPRDRGPRHRRIAPGSFSACAFACVSTLTLPTAPSPTFQHHTFAGCPRTLRERARRPHASQQV